MLHSAIGFGILLASLCSFSLQAQQRSTDQIRWKLFFNQIFALEIRKQWQGENRGSSEIAAALKKYTAYTPHTFNETIDDVLQAETSEEAYFRRQAIFDQNANYATISQVDFTQSIPANIRSIPSVARYLRGIESQKNRSIAPEENFFRSAEGQNLIQAISFQARQAAGQKVALVLVPGYAAHVIKFGIFPEIVADMNRLQGREEARPILSEGNGFDITYEDFRSFYGKSRGGPTNFDILTPSGWEMGNTVGYNAESSDLLAKWIKDLPPSYKDHKLILLGYSKGAPIILECMQRHPELKQRVIGFLTYGAALQGTHIARDGAKEIRAYLGQYTIRELIDKIKSRGVEASLDRVLPFLSPFYLGFLQVKSVQDILDIFGVESSQLDEKVDRIFNGREVSELLDGVDDLSPLTRTTWNLRHFDNGLVNPGTFMFNLSGVTDISSFAARMAADNQRQRTSSLLTPKLDRSGKILWKNFSLDAWFLYLASMPGFRLAPGGLYDTQVDLQHTKGPWLDKSPLSASLTPEELKAIWDTADIRQKLQAEGVTGLNDFTRRPRSELLRSSSRDSWRNYDLGEFKGHHWSLFHQAFRVPTEISTDYAIWDFPRKAFMRALLQTVALYNVIYQSEG